MLGAMADNNVYGSAICAGVQVETNVYDTLDSDVMADNNIYDSRCAHVIADNNIYIW